MALTGHTVAVATNLPESELLDVREYLYVDAPRVRNLLAQFEAGLPEQGNVTRTRSRGLTAAIGSVFGLENVTGHGEEQTRTLSDVHVSMLEESATALGALRDVSQDVTKPKTWNRGKVARALKEGSLIRVTAATQLIDPTAIAATVQAMDKASESKAHPGFAKSVEDTVEALYGDSLALRIMPCGESEPECAFIGQLVDKSGYLGDERRALFSRLGGKATEWTTLAQVSRIPATGAAADTSWTAAMARINSGLDDPDSLNRAMFEKLLVTMMDALEAHGLQAAPRHPEISVTPLAIYRPVLPVEDLSDSDDE